MFSPKLLVFFLFPSRGKNGNKLPWGGGGVSGLQGGGGLGGVGGGSTNRKKKDKVATASKDFSAARFLLLFTKKIFLKTIFTL